ncbi:hypothetical protein M0813_16946 [Anaeramoeba flamelloides]|uniref:Uncharacterized protein n=1 Tax=Anaeramoeba flamelloides TaxID=1746091 RepID=A0ABQ8YY90_9EUKA|nr:hypothetical protein M0813_16946 [Anaeramoeba flamelloides]
MKISHGLLFVVFLGIVCCAGFKIDNFFLGEWDIELKLNKQGDESFELVDLVTGKYDLRKDEENEGTIIGEYYEKAISENDEEPETTVTENEEETEEDDKQNLRFLVKIVTTSDLSGEFSIRKPDSDDWELIFNIDFESKANVYTSFSAYKPDQPELNQQIQFVVINENTFVANIYSGGNVFVVSGIKPRKQPGMLQRFAPMILMVVMMGSRFFMKGPQQRANPNARPNNAPNNQEQANEQESGIVEIPEEDQQETTTTTTTDTAEVVVEEGEEN